MYYSILYDTFACVYVDLSCFCYFSSSSCTLSSRGNEDFINVGSILKDETAKAYCTSWACENFQTLPLLSFLLLRFYVCQTREDIQHLTTLIKIMYLYEIIFFFTIIIRFKIKVSGLSNKSSLPYFCKKT
jgi:hypothetical protein